MKDYPPPDVLLARLRRDGLRTRKRLGQHFLTDATLLTTIAEAAGADQRTLVIEIGPGPATLTTALRARAGGVLAIERDDRLRGFHRELFGADDRVQILYADVLQVDLWGEARRIARRWGLDSLVLAGNIPFQITSPLLFGQLGPDQPWERMTLMIQKEVADRVTARPGTKAYGILTVKLAYAWRATRRIEAPARMFQPRPKVDASVLVFEPLAADERPPLEKWQGLSAFIDRCFNQRRKKLYNMPIPRTGTAPGKEAIRRALEELDLSPDVRAEALTPHQFIELYRRLTPE